MMGDVVSRNAEPTTILLLGGGGFIGSYLATTLHRRGWRIIRTVRAHGQVLAEDERECDLTRMLSPADWASLLDGVDVVVNAVGILRETGPQTFETIHYTAPLALAKACTTYGVSRFIQISALGVAQDGEFIASKHRFDECLLELPLQSVVLRPSVVYSTSGSYGGSSLLRAMAAMPGMTPVPGDGHWRIQPVAAEDLAEIVARAIDNAITGLYEIGGPEPVSLKHYLLAWRRWLRIRGQHALPIPATWVSVSVKIGEALGRGPMGETMWRMIRRENILAPGANETTARVFDFTPRALDQVLADSPSLVQDRWHAQLYFLAPALHVTVVALWLISALAGFLTPSITIERMTTGTWLQPLHPVLLARLGGIVDLSLGLWLLSRWRPRLAISAMLLLLAGYTLVLGLGIPWLWLDPLGGLAKNGVLLPALGVLWVLSDTR